jgi:ApaG protein
MSSSRYVIAVRTRSRYLDDQSDPAQPRYVFGYTVTLRNDGAVAAQLLTRHWIITDGNGKVEEVRGDGVIGQQPTLQPGEGFEYSSGAVLETAIGSMRGSYQMLAEDGTRFDAPIAPFTLSVPRALN